MLTHLTAKSSNAKTGPIAVSTSSRKQCPDSCPLKGNGCYADSGPLALHWRKVSAGERGTDWQGLCEFVASLPKRQLWRHNQSGDLPHKDGIIDSDLMVQLINANQGRRGYTYTHHTLTNENIGTLQLTNALGFTVNASTESLEAADAAMAHGLPAVAVVPSDSVLPERTPAGRKAVLCPAQSRDVSCAECGLCAQADRTCVVMFKAHGTAKKTVNELVA